jgi:hypothetical protein
MAVVIIVMDEDNQSEPLGIRERMLDLWQRARYVGDEGVEAGGNTGR